MNQPCSRFWQTLDQLVAAHPVRLDRPRGTPHPRFPEIIYEQDYGFLEGTCSPDGEPVDVFVGSAGGGVTGVLLSVDLTKQDCELKLLLGCSEQEMQSIEAFFNRHSSIAGKLVRRKE